MKINSTTKGLLLAGFAFVGLLQSCESSLERIEDWEAQGPSTVSSNIKEVKAPEGFNFATTANSTFSIVAQDEESGELMTQVGVQLFKELPNGTLSLVAKGATDANGVWEPNLTLPTYTDSLLIQVIGAGFPQWHRISVTVDRATDYNLGMESNSTGRIIEDPLEGPANPSQGLKSGGLSSRSGYEYMGSYTNWGRPNYLTTSRRIDSDLVNFVNSNLPLRGTADEINENYFNEQFSNSLVFNQDGELWLTFAHEGAGYLNSIGFFTFDPNNPPTSVDDIDVRTIAFPNASYRRSGGSLSSGHRVYLGEFEKGTGVGWFLVPNGYDWRNRTVRESSATRYSIDELNTFTDDPYRRHMIMLTNNTDEYFVLGIEDLNRPSGDNDFNDVIMIVDASPWGAVEIATPPADPVPADTDGDGVADFNDLYPLDPERAFTSYAPGQGNYGTIAFEDMWPRLGDYDFNDLVVDYSFIEILDAKERVKDIELSLSVRAMGASQNHGFAMRLPIDPSQVESVTGQLITDDYIRVASNGTEAGMRETIIPMFTDGFALFGDVQRGGIVNTNPELPMHNPGRLTVKITFRNALEKDILGGAPYDPFMLRSQNRSREIHLAGNHPTAAANMATFNTEADASNLETGFYYIDENNLPWAIHVPESFIYPQEQVAINKVYENFAEWATFGGESNRGWYQNTSGNVNASNGF